MKRALAFLAGWLAGVLSCYVGVYVAAVRWLTRGVK